MSLKTAFKTNESCETEGVWNDFGEFRVKLARAGGSNKAYTKSLERRVKPLKRRLDSLSNEESKSIMRDLLVEHCIKGWQTKVEGVWKDGIDFDGESLLSVTRENLLTVLAELPDLEQQLLQCVQDQAAYREELLEAAAGN